MTLAGGSRSSSSLNPDGCIRYKHRDKHMGRRWRPVGGSSSIVPLGACGRPRRPFPVLSCALFVVLFAIVVAHGEQQQQGPSSSDAPLSPQELASLEAEQMEGMPHGRATTTTAHMTTTCGTGTSGG